MSAAGWGAGGIVGRAASAGKESGSVSTGAVGRAGAAGLAISSAQATSMPVPQIGQTKTWWKASASPVAAPQAEQT
jgi:hypothetical protein